jgi:hypothetical protein
VRGRKAAHWIVAYVAVGLSAGLAAWYGARSAEDIPSAVLQGAIMFVIAILGCHGWAWAARTAKDGHRGWATVSWVFLTVAMLVTLLGGAGQFYGAMTNRRAAADRSSDAYVRADAEIKKLEARQLALTKHRSKGEIEPDIQTYRSDQRFKTSKSCSPESTSTSADFCREYRDLLKEIAAANEGERLEALKGPHNAVVGKGKPAKTGTPGSLIVLIASVVRPSYEMSQEMGDAIFSLLCTVALDAGALIALLTAELRNESEPHQEERTEQPEAKPEPAEATLSNKLPPLPLPQLVAANSDPPAGSIPKILNAILEPAAGRRVEIEECHGGYAAQCRAEGKRVVRPAQFVDPLKQFCRRAGIRTKSEGDRFYLMDVRLVVDVRQREAAPI